MDQNGNFKNVSSFFGFDGIPYQYVGLKRRDGVNTGNENYIITFRNSMRFKKLGINNLS
jgi:hypothetical protein